MCSLHSHSHSILCSLTKLFVENAQFELPGTGKDASGTTETAHNALYLGVSGTPEKQKQAVRRAVFGGDPAHALYIGAGEIDKGELFVRSLAVAQSVDDGLQFPVRPDDHGAVLSRIGARDHGVHV